MVIKRLYSILTLIVLLVLTGCLNSNPTEIPNQQEKSETVPPKFTHVTETITPTIKISESSLTPILTPLGIDSVTPSPKAKYAVYQKNCYPLSNDLSNVEQITNNLLLDGSYFDKPVVLREEDGSLNTLAYPSYKSWPYVYVSPNHEYIALKNYSESNDRSELLIFDKNASIIARFEWMANWRKIAGWLNDHQVIISYQVNDYLNDSNLLVDVFSSETTKLPSNYPFIETAGDLFYKVKWGGNSHSGVYYHPTLKFVAYTKYQTKVGLVISKIPEDYIFDIKKNYTVAFLPGDSGYYPTWSPDGSRLAVINKPAELPDSNRDQQELFLIGLDGKIEKLTDFNHDQYLVQMDGLSWSPDGKKIAFLMGRLKEEPTTEEYPDTSAAPRLVILDLLNGVITDTCVPGDEYPVWSADGKTIAITHVYQRSLRVKGHLYLVNLADKKSYIIMEDYFPVFWVAE